MDAGGVRPGLPDSLDLGADDNASGTAGLLALAQAFNQPGARPRRSLLFFATSGGAPGKDAWAANAYFGSGNAGPYYDNLVGVLNLDMIAGGAQSISG